MDARTFRLIVVASALLLFLGLGSFCEAAGFRTQNFIVQAPTAGLAKAVGESAERYRQELSTYWLGRQLPAWPTPCPIRVVPGPRLAAQGVTTYNRAPVRDFQMEVIGTPERILDSVLPHEVTHTVLATHFGRPLPRWADEGICTTVEHQAERSKLEAKLREFLSTRRGIAMNQMFLLTEYPSDVLPLYAQGYSVCQFLIGQKDARAFIDFLTDYMRRPSWTENIRKHYGYKSLASLQENWLGWVAKGGGPIGKYAGTLPKKTNPAIAQVSATQILPAPSSSLNQPANSTAISAITPPPVVDQDGWYQRRKSDSRLLASNQLQHPQSGAGGRGQPPAIRPIVPPSIRTSGRYSAAQPQPQMQMSRGDLPREASNSGGISGRWPTQRHF